MQSRCWPIETIVKRSCALATAYYRDIEPVHSQGWHSGIRTDYDWKQYLRFADELVG